MIYEYVIDDKTKDRETGGPTELVTVMHHKRVMIHGPQTGGTILIMPGSYTWCVLRSHSRPFQVLIDRCRPFSIRLPEKYPGTLSHPQGRAKIAYEFRAQVGEHLYWARCIGPRSLRFSHSSSLLLLSLLSLFFLFLSLSLFLHLLALQCVPTVRARWP